MRILRLSERDDSAMYISYKVLYTYNTSQALHRPNSRTLDDTQTLSIKRIPIRVAYV